MAISIDWPTGVIFVPKADTQLVQASPNEIRQLDMDFFRRELRRLEDTENGRPSPITSEYTGPVNIGGVQLAPVVRVEDTVYTVTFENGLYAVNLVGANTNLQDVANVNNVSIRPSNSAGLTYSKQSEDTAFYDGRVYINTLTGRPGTSYPRGTLGDPVDNLADAQTIIATRTLAKRILLRGDLALDATADVSNYDILGFSQILSTIAVSEGANTENCILEKLSISGDINGRITAREATSLDNLQDFDGSLVRCGLNGTVSLGTATNVHELVDCFAQEDGLIVDCRGIPNLNFYSRRWDGPVVISNFVSGTLVMGVVSGQITLEDTCTGGTIALAGTAGLIDESGDGCTVNRDNLVSNLVGNYAGE